VRDGSVMGARPVTVLTVDDQEVFRRAARSLIAATPGFEQIGEATSGMEALALATQLRPDLVLVDVRMPEMDGIETSRRLLEGPDQPMVILISLDDVGDPDTALATSGAIAHVRKQELSTRTLPALWAANRGASVRA
jgi:two-component system, NarL family, invasion response regulator UvrY